MATKNTLTVEGILKAVTPKHAEGTEWVGGRNVPKGNTLDLLISVKVPSPKPPASYDKWLREEGRDWDNERKIQEKQRQLQKQLDAGAPAVKPPRGGHFFKAQPAEGATEEHPEGSCIGHKKCGNLVPDGVKCHAMPEAPSKDDLKEQLQTELNAFIAEIDVGRRAKYDQYVEACNTQTQKAMLASLGSGMFFALMGQEVKVDFAPSDRVFQPMLDAAKTLPGMLSLPESAAPEPSAPEVVELTMGSNAAPEDDDEDDEYEHQLEDDEEEE